MAPYWFKRRLLAQIFFEFHAWVQKCHFGRMEKLPNGTFEPMHEIQKHFGPKDFFWGIMKVPFTKIIHNFFEGLPDPGFWSVKVQTETLFKKDSRNFNNSFYLGFLWIPSKPGKQNWKWAFLWVFIIVKKQCDLTTNRQ